MVNIIACRVASYGRFVDRAWSHLREIEIQCVEIPVPAPAEQQAVQRRLADHGLRATSLQARCEISSGDAAEIMRPQLESCAAFGAKICLLCVKAGQTDRAVVWDRLRRIGDAAAKVGVTVALETHPDLVTNAAISQQTITVIGHPNVRINFDTANIYFYNQGLTAIGELEKIVDLVAAVHLKDTPGGYQEWNFPALGTGILDFPEVFRLMNTRGFSGPFTIELEGIRGVDRDEATQLRYITESVEHLRKIGAL